MVPTLLDGDIMILDKIGYRINGLKRFDIVVIKYNNEKIIKEFIAEHKNLKEEKEYKSLEKLRKKFDEETRRKVIAYRLIEKI